MANTLMHKTETLKATTVRTVDELREALYPMHGDELLGETMEVRLIAETFSDGSTVYEVRVRPVGEG